MKKIKFTKSVIWLSAIIIGVISSIIYSWIVPYLNNIYSCEYSGLHWGYDILTHGYNEKCTSLLGIPIDFEFIGFSDNKGYRHLVPVAPFFGAFCSCIWSLFIIIKYQDSGQSQL
ncbi:hypothetical protein [Comamonas sp. SCN 65-56]|uniref:hypothetical protein n=1 Tax=Comamonas sp. SCN 65-56 TaxID=1660095 RepID=UPI0025C30AE6|nr:hypothetical protein [Comamonas sp. SCN 65-56]